MFSANASAFDFLGADVKNSSKGTATPLAAFTVPVFVFGAPPFVPSLESNIVDALLTLRGELSVLLLALLALLVSSLVVVWL
jgi:hypothetical protein